MEYQARSEVQCVVVTWDGSRVEDDDTPGWTYPLWFPGHPERLSPEMSEQTPRP